MLDALTGYRFISSHFFLAGRVPDDKVRMSEDEVLQLVFADSRRLKLLRSIACVIVDMATSRRQIQPRGIAGNNYGQWR